MKEAYRRGRVLAMPFLVNHLVELQYLKQDQIQSSWSDDEDGQEGIIDAWYLLTPGGKQLLEKWNLK